LPSTKTHPLVSKKLGKRLHLQWHMPVFRCDFTVRSDLVLPSGRHELTFRTVSGFVVLFRNGSVDAAGHALDLLVSVIGPADSMDTARDQLQTALAAQLDLLSFVTHSRFRIAAPLQMMEWDEGQRTRQYDVFHASDPREPPDPELEMPYLESAAAIDQSTLPDYTRTALRYFRYGLIDDQPEDQFMRFWLALEIIAENIKSPDRVPIACPKCKSPLKCTDPQCGCEPTRIPMAKQAIESLITRLATSAMAETSNWLFSARNALMHGKSSRAIERDCKVPFTQIVNDLGMITWKAAMSTISFGDGPPLAFGHRDGQFVVGSMIMGVRAILGEGPHPAEMPKLDITMQTHFRKRDEDS
jgi:hypothetical protein